MAKHAPRGPIKARGEADPSTLAPMKGRCTAKSSRTGKPCAKYPINGGTVCRTHGGAAPQVKAKALERLMALQNPAIDCLTKLIERQEYPSTAYAAARDVLDRTMGKPTESVQVEQSGELTIRWQS